MWSQVYLSRCLGGCHRAPRSDRGNAAEIVKAPRLEEEGIEPYSIEEVQRLLVEAAKLRNSARWVVALAFGLPDPLIKILRLH
jgi:hypothetical protein